MLDEYGTIPQIRLKSNECSIGFYKTMIILYTILQGTMVFDLLHICINRRMVILLLSDFNGSEKKGSGKKNGEIIRE